MALNLKKDFPLELGDSCDLSIIVIVSNNCDYDSMLSYYCDKLHISVFSQKRSKHDIVKVKVIVKACTTTVYITIFTNIVLEKQIQGVSLITSSNIMILSLS